ncbi:MAG TPA: type I-C CRISPR-associated protein Cas5 [Ruminococcaceae bacterium]|nr:type I-C CRISPR-associated protein Cas5 [Oscillospiraceae bacterium]
MKTSYGFKILAESDYALFTSPDAKVERASYPVPTPSALTGMLKNLAWKPPIRYVIDKIVVFNQIKYANIRRNEVKSKVIMSKVKAQMKGEGSPEIFTSEERSQRAAMILSDVKYGIEFHFELTGIKSEREDECEEKYYNIIKRRLEKGQCFRTPYFGCREFAVKKIQLVEDFKLEEISPDLMGDTDLGFMLYEMKFEDGGIPVGGDWDNPKFSDNADPVFYHPHIVDGVIDVEKYRRDLKC